MSGEERFKSGDLVKLSTSKNNDNTLGILQESYDVGNEKVWFVFHVESNKSFRVFEQYIIRIPEDENGG